MARGPKRLVDANAPRLEGERGVFALLARTEVGRMPRCAVRLDDHEVSKLHCTVTIQNETVRVTDEGSANGTYVNGFRVRDRLLREGDELTVGQTRFTVRLGSLPSPPRGVEGESIPMLDIGFVLRKTSETLDAVREKEARLDAEISATEIAKLRIAAEAHRELGVNPDVAAALVGFALRLTGADTVALFAATAESARLRRDGVTEDLPVSAAVLEHVRAHREPVLSTNVRSDPRFLPPVTQVITVHHAVLAAPLVARGQLHGVLYCDSRQRADVFSELDVNLLVGLASHAALLID